MDRRNMEGHPLGPVGREIQQAFPDRGFVEKAIAIGGSFGVHPFARGAIQGVVGVEPVVAQQFMHGLASGTTEHPFLALVAAIRTGGAAVETGQAGRRVGVLPGARGGGKGGIGKGGGHGGSQHR